MLKRVAAMFGRQRRDHELAEELEAHLEFQVEANVRSGMSAAEARRQALIKLGGLEQAKEAYRDRRGLPAVEILLQDVRYAARSLRKSPGFALVAVFTLALGIGANTAIFSVVNAAMLRPLPYRDPQRLVWVTEIWHKQGENASVPSPDYVNWSAQAHSFAELAAYDGGSDANLTGKGDPERIPVVGVTANFFSLLGANLVRGRAFSPREALPGASPVAILSYELWQRRFALDPDILGKAITLDGQSYTLVGVAPRGFRFPDQDVKPQCFVAFQLPTRVNWYAKMLMDTFVIGRLKPGVTPAQAQAEIVEINRRDFAQVSPTFIRLGRQTMQVVVTDLQAKLTGDVRTALLVLLGAVAFVLLIACANVANLQLVRTSARQQEFAIRAAIGAGRARLVRQLLTEGAVLALMGGALGVLVAAGGVRVLDFFAPENLAGLGQLCFDHRVLGFTLGATGLVTVLFGMLPAMAASTPDLQETLKHTSLRAAGAPGSRRARKVLATGEFALALVLLVSSGLLLRSFVLLSNVNPGFRPHGVLTVRLQLPQPKYSAPERQWAFYDQLLLRLEALPGVGSAAVAAVSPLSGFTGESAVRFEGQPSPPPGAAPSVPVTSVSPQYFRTMQIPLISGRAFNATDGSHNDFPIVINKSFAQRFFPGQDPIGKRVRVGAPDWPWRTVIGVVGDVKQLGLSQPPQPEIFKSYATPAGDPIAGQENSAATVFVRTSADALGLASAVRQQVAGLDPNLPVYDVATLDQRLTASLAAPRFNTVLLGLFAAFAWLLAIIGIYGVISYFVSQRTHEIGIRVALGALPVNVLRLLMVEALGITAMGIALGVAVCFAVTRFLGSLLFEVPPTDPLTIAAVSLLLGLVALEASYLPARRAMKVDPMAALRYE